MSKECRMVFEDSELRRKMALRPKRIHKEIWLAGLEFFEKIKLPRKGNGKRGRGVEMPNQ